MLLNSDKLFLTVLVIYFVLNICVLCKYYFIQNDTCFSCMMKRLLKWIFKCSNFYFIMIVVKLWIASRMNQRGVVRRCHTPSHLAILDF